MTKNSYDEPPQGFFDCFCFCSASKMQPKPQALRGFMDGEDLGFVCAVACSSELVSREFTVLRLSVRVSRVLQGYVFGIMISRHFECEV